MTDEEKIRSYRFATELSKWHSASVCDDFIKNFSKTIGLNIGIFHPMNRINMWREMNAVSAGAAFYRFRNTLPYDSVALVTYIDHVANLLGFNPDILLKFDHPYTQKIFEYAHSFDSDELNEMHNNLFSIRMKMEGVVSNYIAMARFCYALLGEKASSVDDVRRSMLAGWIAVLPEAIDVYFANKTNIDISGL